MPYVDENCPYLSPDCFEYGCEYCELANEGNYYD